MPGYSRKQKRRSAARTNRFKRKGGGFATGAPLSSATYYVPEYVRTDDCAQTLRPGALISNPNPDAAQVGMAGGKYRSRSRRSKRKRGGCGCRMRGGYSQKGGRYMIDTANPIGGDGPIMVPGYTSIPCEGHRPMQINPTNATALVNMENPDINMHGIRPAFIQAGGSPTAGSHPLAYEAPRAGFSFYPNIAQGEPLQPGLVPYQNVIPQAAPCTTSCGQAIGAINK